jgi:Reverse transcriptase (RNA-dependent DNA polymerase).
MKAAIKNNLIADEQYSRPGRKSIDHSINRRLVMDHQLYIRQPYVLTSCDLKSCYDRINHTAAGLCLQKAGVEQSEVTALLTTIQLMTHKVRTAFGDSITSYGGEHDKTKWKLPPQGVLQGNGAGPTIWTIISSVLFSILRDKNFHNTFTSVIQKIQLKLAGFAYVDDTDLIQIGNKMVVAVRRMQRLLNFWTSLIEVTGGLLAPEKCWTYMVDYIFRKGKWTTCNHQQEHALCIPTTSNRQHVIQQVDTHTGSNMLGVVMSPNGNNRDHILVLQRKAQTWANNIRRTMSRNMEEVWTALHTTIPYSLSYSLLYNGTDSQRRSSTSRNIFHNTI